MSIACSTGSRAVRERDVVDVQVALDPRRGVAAGLVADLRLVVEDDA